MKHKLEDLHPVLRFINSHVNVSRHLGDIPRYCKREGKPALNLERVSEGRYNGKFKVSFGIGEDGRFSSVLGVILKNVGNENEGMAEIERIALDWRRMYELQERPIIYKYGKLINNDYGEQISG